MENAALPLGLNGWKRRKARSAALDSLRVVELSDRVDHFPDDPSGGPQQRVGIARAVVGPRRIILADEPTGTPDSTTGEVVLRTLRRRVDAGAGGILVSRDARHAAWADRIVFMWDGRIVDENAKRSVDSLFVEVPRPWAEPRAAAVVPGSESRSPVHGGPASERSVADPSSSPETATALGLRAEPFMVLASLATPAIDLQLIAARVSVGAPNSLRRGFACWQAPMICSQGSVLGAALDIPRALAMGLPGGPLAFDPHGHRSLIPDLPCQS